jgi:NADPH2:quinone reductase
MPSAIRIYKVGSPEVMTVEDTKGQEPGPGQAWIEQEAIGVNFLDVGQRKGTTSIPLPSGLGYEAAGRVHAIGAGVENVRVGDRVGYATGPIGSYASGRLYPADRLVRLPDNLGYADAAAILFKALTAQYLIKSTYPVGPGKVVVLYGATGAVGQIMTPWAKHLGATVIGVVSKEANIAAAKALGCDTALVSGPSFAADVARVTDGQKADVVYDAVGRATFQSSLDSLRPRGMLVSFGASSGPVPPVDVSTLNAKGSLFLTRPSVFAYAAQASEYQQRMQDILAAWTAGIIKPTIWKTYPLANASDAHAALEAGKSSGAIVLIP